MKQWRITEQDSTGYVSVSHMREDDSWSLEEKIAFLEECGCRVIKLEVSEVSEWEEV